MKSVLHPKRRAVFGNWLHRYLAQNEKRYIWPQICYETGSARPIHLVFEKNRFNAPVIMWPVSHFCHIPSTHIDFTSFPPSLPSGEPWDYTRWHTIALNGPLRHGQCSGVPTSFWDWRKQTVPQGNLTCDLDGIFKDRSGRFIGIEATQIYHVTESADVERDVFEHFKRLFLLRHGRTGGFNLWQLKAQKRVMDLMTGRLFMLFHLIVEKSGGIHWVGEDRVLLLEIDDDALHLIETMIKTKVMPLSLKKRITYHNIHAVFERLF